jgi:flagellar hook assembly protein FlgD
VFTLTGSEIPDDFRIQIMTITGLLVGEIRMAELGPIRIGRNMTEFAWDGHDEFGDQLANGVYLYRVVAKKADGSDFEFFEQNNIDGMFKHGLGKMVLMR